MFHLAFFHFFPFMSGAVGWVIFVFFLFPYFLPTIIAMIRRNDSAGAIFALNFLLGWTFIGWIASLVWALSSNRITMVVNNAGPTYNPAPPIYQTAQQTSHQTNPTVRPSATNTRPANPQDKIDQLRQLKQLLDEGVLTQEEFDKQKAAILG
jgi:hypothetical protein